jgi:hypothetical protein
VDELIEDVFQTLDALIGVGDVEEATNQLEQRLQRRADALDVQLVARLGPSEEQP